NATLAQAVAKAKAASMPNDNIERAIKRGSGELDEGVTYDEFFYEGYGPSGVAVLVKILTDNRNRASSDVRVGFTRHGGSLGEPGSVAYLFDQRGYVLVAGDEDDVMLVALDAGADDVRDAGDGRYEVITDPSDFMAVRQAIEDAGLVIEQAEVTFLPSVTVPLDAESVGKVLRLVDALEDIDDVQDVYANFDVDESVLEQAT
ncbi:MAG: YebC/PmpR family DNA-binding transcriptional regulator, partial [Acidimicrobiia bacterium]